MRLDDCVAVAEIDGDDDAVGLGVSDEDLDWVWEGEGLHAVFAPSKMMPPYEGSTVHSEPEPSMLTSASTACAKPAVGV